MFNPQKYAPVTLKQWIAADYLFVSAGRRVVAAADGGR